MDLYKRSVPKSLFKFVMTLSYFCQNSTEPVYCRHTSRNDTLCLKAQASTGVYKVQSGEICMKYDRIPSKLHTSIFIYLLLHFLAFEYNTTHAIFITINITIDRAKTNREQKSRNSTPAARRSLVLENRMNTGIVENAEFRRSPSISNTTVDIGLLFSILSSLLQLTFKN